MRSGIIGIKARLNHFSLEKFLAVFPNSLQSVERLEAIQGYKYADKRIALVALIHRSALVHWPVNKVGIQSNEVLEFLGDSFLNYFMATESLVRFPSWREGELSKLRAALVGTENLSEKSIQLGLGDLLIFGKGELNKTPQKHTNILADAFEAITAALLVDAGEEVVWSWLMSCFESDLFCGDELLKNYDAKTKFQQWVQGIIGIPPTYRVIGTESTPQASKFIVAGFVGESEISRAKHANKREASKLVAQKMLDLVNSGSLTADDIKKMFEKCSETGSNE